MLPFLISREHGDVSYASFFIEAFIGSINTLTQKFTVKEAQGTSLSSEINR